MEVMRVSISDGTRPVYVQMMLTTGTLMAGKISTGVRIIMTGAIRNSSSARTTKVYGRESAMRTIHIEDLKADALYPSRMRHAGFKLCLRTNLSILKRRQNARL